MVAGFLGAAISRQDGSSADGIHLLWTAPPQIGYSIDGFDIQRRERRRREESCYTLTPGDLDSLHQLLRVNVPHAVVGLRRSECPTFPSKVPDEPFHDQGPNERCTDFQHRPIKAAPNPLKESTGTYLVRDFNGQPNAQTFIQRMGPHTGLDCGWKLEIDLTDTANTVEDTLVHFARPAEVEARRANNTVAARAVMSQGQGQPETVVLTAEGIRRVIDTSPQNETQLHQLCVSAQPKPQLNCVDFTQAAPGPGPNPRDEKGISFAVTRDGTLVEKTLVTTIQSHTGLFCSTQLDIRLPTTVKRAELKIVFFGEPPRVTARSEDGTIANAPLHNAVAGKPQNVNFSGEALRSFSIIGGGQEVLLLSFCIEPPSQDNLPIREPKKEIASRFVRPAVDLHQEQFSPTHLTANVAASVAPPPVCIVYDIRLKKPHYTVRVIAGLPVTLAIAMNEGKAVETKLLSTAGGVQTAIFQNRVVDQVLLYATSRLRSLTICVDVEDPQKEESAWASEPFIAKNIHLPVRNVNPTVGSVAAERALASSRLLPGETFDAARFDEVAKLMNDTAANATAVSPMTQVVLTRESQDDPFVEVRGWPYAFALLTEADWRRMLGFGFFDKGSGLTPGTVYDYRIIGRFRRRDLFERLLGFHNLPLGTTLPRWFHLGPVLLKTEDPAEVTLFPAPPVVTLRAAGRKGIRLRPDGPGNSSLQLSFAEPVTRVVLEIEPGQSTGLRYEATTSDFLLGLTGSLFSNPVPNAFRAELQFPEPVDKVTLFGEGLLYGVRIPTEPPTGGPNDVLRVSFLILGVRYEPTAPPVPPPFLGTMNLQQPQLAGDPHITTQQPPQHLGFHLFWLPPPATGSTIAPWPPDLAAFPPFDVSGFHLERRRVDTSGPFANVDDSASPTKFFGNRSSRRDPPNLYPGIDLALVFPDVVQPEPPISVLMDVEDTLRSLAKPDGPPPGSLHQYRIFSVDAIGRRSATPTLGSIVRLEKRVPPPQPVGPTTPPPAGVQRPVGVTARALQALDSRLTPSDRTLLGASDNAIVLEWAWTQAERDRDPFATEFRIYFRPLPPDLVRGSLTGAATLAGSLWQMAATLNQPIRSNALRGQYLRTPSGPFKVSANGAGQNITISFEKSAIDPAVAPLATAIEFPIPPDADELRPTKWPERTAVIPITAQTDYQFVFRNRLTITAVQPEVRVWVGVSAADNQSYIPDEIPSARPNGGRPGNESSLVPAPVNARYLGRPVFVVPPPLPNVPEQVTNEPVNNEVSVSLNLSGLLPAVVIPPGFKVKLERLGADELLNRISANSNETIGARLPNGTNPSYTLGNPGDQAAFLSQIRTGEGVRVEGRFIMDFLTRHLAALEPLWQSSAIKIPVTFGALTDTLPGKSERYIHRIRLVDQAGHVSVGGAILPQFVRVPTLAAPGSPEFELPNSQTNSLTLSARVRDAFDVKWLVLFTLNVDANDPLDKSALEKAQLLRLPNRRDLYPNNGIRLRLADGTVLAPANAVDVTTGTLEVPDRVLNVPIAAGFNRRVSAWAIAMTRDGITSRIIGPRTAFTGAAPLTVPALTVTSAAQTDLASWGVAPSDAEVSLERSTDGGTSWSRVTPWMRPTETSFAVPAVSGARAYRLRLRASLGRSATGPAVSPA
jgi:hypothetical protein